MLTHIARFEFRYLLRNPLFRATAAVMFAAIFVSISVDGFGLAEGGVLENSAYATLQKYLVFSVLFLFVATAFVANAVIRDDETGFGPIIRSTRITKFEYLIGRFLGAYAIAALCMLLVPLAILLGSLMPWADPAHLGPNRLIDHLYGYFLIALPNLLVTSAILFALATITRSMMATYLGVVGLLSGYFVLEKAFSDRPRLVTTVAVAEPFGLRAIVDATRYWTATERNALLPDFSGALLYNRLLWVGISVLFLALAYVAYRFADPGMTKREREKQKLAQRSPEEAPVATSFTSLPSPRHGKAALRALIWMRTRFEARQVVVSPAFAVLMAFGMFSTLATLIADRDPDGRPTYPITLSMIPELEGSFSLIPLIIAIYYAGELVWRERDRRVHELVDAAPLPNWAYVVPKTLAISLVLMATLLTSVVASVIIQLSLGYTNIELGKYLLWYVLPMTWDMLLLAALAVFVQALSPHKAVGWGVMVLFLLAQLQNVFDHNLLEYGGTPDTPLSDMNGAGSFWKGAWVFRAYWGALAILLLVAAHLLWRRGTEIRLKPRLARARRRLAGEPGWIAGAALVVFIATGAHAYYNTNILNEYRTRSARDDDAAEFEKRYWKYHGLPQPTIVEVTLNIELYPEERRAVTQGHYLLRNLNQQPVADVHVRLEDSDLELTSATLAGARLSFHDEKYDYRIYRLDHPMQPGEERLLTFETRRWHRGFRNESPNTRLIENGTFLSQNELMPVIGMSRGGLLKDRITRRKYGLPAELPRPKLEDASATAKPGIGGGWTKADITVSTAADQTPIAPGRKVSDVTRGGRRITRFVSQAPILAVFSVQSARYAEQHRLHAGVDLAVYYHPPHAWNVDRMLDGLAASLDYYQSNFGPYPFDHVRIVEFPGYQYFAQAFAGTIPYSESLGFISDYHEPETIDHVTYVTAHELAHQYWGHQVVGADMQGEGMLAETLSQYSALMVAKKLYGEDQIRRFLQFELDRYLEGRAHASGDEPPLARVRNESYITHRKGSLAMYLLQKRLGEDAINRALRQLVHRYRFQGAPYPRSLDFIEALRAEARTAEEQALITDLFERVTLYDLKVTQPTAVQRADGRWDVTVPVEAKKFYAHEQGAETETPLAERIEVGLFTAEPGRDVFDTSNVLLIERHPVRTGQQVLKFVTTQKPTHAGIDPYNFYIDRNSADNVLPVN
jgi:ABC-type transport system involved in multi-copper enzyme maturation permease subunit